MWYDRAKPDGKRSDAQPAAKPDGATDAARKPDDKATDSELSPDDAADNSDVPPVIAPEKSARSPNGLYEFREERWGRALQKKIEEMIGVLRSKGVPVLWVGLPVVRGPKATADTLFLDSLYRDAAGKAGITEQLTYHYTNEEEGKTLRRYWTTACQGWVLKSKCTTGKERRISRWEHEAVLEAVQARLDRNPAKMRERRQTVEHPFGTIKSWMGATHFQMKTLKHVGTEMALHVLAYNMKRVMRILGVGGLIGAIRA
jgi:hypothetical protein